MALVNTYLLPDESASLSGNSPGYNRLGVNIPNYCLMYDADRTEAAFWKMRAINYGSNSSISVDFMWHSTGGIVAGNVVWAGSIAAITSGDPQNFGTKTFAVPSVVTGTCSSTVSGVVQNTLVINSLDSLASGDIFWLQLARSGTSAGDTMLGDAVLMDLNLYYSN